VEPENEWRKGGGELFLEQYLGKRGKGLEVFKKNAAGSRSRFGRKGNFNQEKPSPSHFSPQGGGERVGRSKTFNGETKRKIRKGRREG